MEENTQVLLTDGDEREMDASDGERIDNDWGSGEDSSPAVTEADWDATDPGVDEDRQSDGSFRLKHLGRELNVTRDEVIALAQKGVDYDRIRSRADALAANLRLRDSAATAGGMGTFPEAQRRERESREFISVYKDVKPESIPQEVWREVADGKSLLSAYQSYENRMLRLEIDAGRRDIENRRKSTGSRTSLGAAITRDELETDWYRD